MDENLNTVPDIADAVDQNTNIGPDIADAMGFSRLMERVITANFIESVIFILILILAQFFIFKFVQKNFAFAEKFHEQNIRLKIVLVLFSWFFFQLCIFHIEKPTELIDHYSDGSSGINYDYFIQEKLRDGSLKKDPEFFMHNSPCGTDTLRRPLSGLVYVVLWFALEDRIMFKYFYSVINLMSVLLLYHLISNLFQSKRLAYLSSLLFLICPLNFSATMEWTWRVGETQLGVLMIIIALLYYVKYCFTKNLKFLFVTFICHIMAFLSYETFFGFIIMYPVISYYLLKTKRIESGSIVKVPFLYCIAFGGSVVILKKMVELLYPVYGFDDPGSAASLGQFINQWKINMLGSDKPEEWAVKGVFYYLKNFPIYFTGLHFFEFSNVFKNIPIAIGSVCVSTVLNVSIVLTVSNKNNEAQPLSAKAPIIIGVLLFISAIITSLLAMGQIWERYLYCGYFGMTLFYATIYYKLRLKEKYNIANLILFSMLTIFQFVTLARVMV